MRRLPWLIALLPLSLAGQSRTRPQVQPAVDTVITKTDQARSVVAEAKRAALNIENDFQRGLVLDQIGAAEAKTGDLNLAVETANRAYPHASSTLRALGEQLPNSNQSGDAQSIGRKLTHDQSSSVFAFIADRQAETGKIGEALATTEHIRDSVVRGDVLKGIAHLQAANGDDSGARKTLALARAAHGGERIDPDDDEVEMIITEGEISRGAVQAARKTIASLRPPESRAIGILAGVSALLKRGDKANAGVWLEDALRGLPSGPGYDLLRYFAIPLEVTVGQRERAMQIAAALSPDLRVKGYAAVAVACAEARDVDGVDAALGKAQSARRSESEDKKLSDFGAKLMILNVSAALIDNGEFETAARLLTSVEAQLDDVSLFIIGPRAQLERVFMLSLQGAFDEARSVALKMRPDAVSDIERGTALRTVALLQTKKTGVASTEPWALALADSEDRAYALIGVVQGLLEIADPKLGYSAIQAH